MNNAVKKTKIGIDFDRVFVNNPPLIPEMLIERLYKKKNGDLYYRFPGQIEQRVRVFSHSPFFRHPIGQNLQELEKLANNKNVELYLISSRFSFLKKRTEEWLSRHKILRFFKKTFFNYKNEQPHLFKNRIIKENEINCFIDDDLDLLIFLAPLHPKVKFYWLSRSSKTLTLPSNLEQIKNLHEFRIKKINNE